MIKYKIKSYFTNTNLGKEILKLQKIYKKFKKDLYSA